MPNWCNNTFEIVGPKEKIKEFEQFLEQNEGKNWFDFFAPCPQELQDVGNVSPLETNEKLVEKYGYSDWYSFGLGEWGCKWNCDAQDWTVENYDEENDFIRFWFDSPWGPPTELYENIQNGKFGEGLNVFAEWHEPGMQFVGWFQAGENESYEYNDLDSLDDIPDELVDNWGLRDELESYDDDEEEEEEYPESDCSTEITIENSDGNKKWPF